MSALENNFTSWKLTIIDALTFDDSLSDGEKIIGIRLIQHADHKTRQIYPSQLRLAVQVGITEHAAYKIIRKLQDNGWLEVQTGYRKGARGKRNSYAFAEERVVALFERNAQRMKDLKTPATNVPVGRLVQPEMAINQRPRGEVSEGGLTSPSGGTNVPVGRVNTYSEHLSEDRTPSNLNERRVDSSSARAKTDFPSGEKSASLGEAAKPKEERDFLTEEEAEELAERNVADFPVSPQTVTGGYLTKAEVELWEDICFNMPPGYDQRLRRFFLSQSVSDNQFFNQVRAAAISQGNMPDGVAAAAIMLDDRPEGEPTKH